MKDYNLLEQYVDFCIDNNTKTKNGSDYHHILPQAQYLPFGEFTNLKDNPWNGTYLQPTKHIMAHVILAKAVDHLSVDKAVRMLSQFGYDMSELKEEEVNEIILRGRKWSDKQRRDSSKRQKGVPKSEAHKQSLRKPRINKENFQGPKSKAHRKALRKPKSKSGTEHYTQEDWNNRSNKRAKKFKIETPTTEDFIGTLNDFSRKYPELITNTKLRDLMYKLTNGRNSKKYSGWKITKIK